MRSAKLKKSTKATTATTADVTKTRPSIILSRTRATNAATSAEKSAFW